MVGKKSKSYQVFQKSQWKYLRTNSPNALSHRISGIPDMTSIFFQPSEVGKNYQETLSRVGVDYTNNLCPPHMCGLGLGTILMGVSLCTPP
jgi:hypothetical protein